MVFARANLDTVLGRDAALRRPRRVQRRNSPLDSKKGSNHNYSLFLLTERRAAGHSDR